MLGKILLVVSILSGVSLLVLLSCTTPTSVGPLGILAFFVFVYLVCVGLVTGLIFLIPKVISISPNHKKHLTRTKQISIKKSYYLGSVLALAPVLILAVQSFGGIGFLEFTLIIIFISLGCVLVVKH